jgi:hypothetical protein
MIHAIMLIIVVGLILGASHIAIMGRVRAHHSFVDGPHQYKVLVRERSNETQALDWLLTLLGFVGFHHPGRYSYSAELYESSKRIAFSGWSNGDIYYERHVTVLSADRTRIVVSYGGEYTTEEFVWRSR